MLLEIPTTHTPAGDLGYLLHKHPGRVQTFKLAFGDAHVFYPDVTAERCVAALLIDVDPVALVRGKGRERTLDQYVNDRPYVASSMLAVAIAQVFGPSSNTAGTRPCTFGRVPVVRDVGREAAPLQGDGRVPVQVRRRSPEGRLWRQRRRRHTAP
ncbi:MAG: hypothetical protein IT432_14885 [Phycisphaerales bacterium]|nr:hypothetical protein [Phycisphaerales bacterium]